MSTDEGGKARFLTKIASLWPAKRASVCFGASKRYRMPRRLSRQSISEWQSSTDFSTLPGYDELRVYRSIGQKFGVESPYFRTHEGRAGSHTQIAGQSLLNFSSYDYLGLNGHPEISLRPKSLDRYGVSASASRHVAGERPVHHALERALADHYGVAEVWCLSVAMPPISA